MNYFVRLAQINNIYWLIPLFIAALVAKLWWHKRAFYAYPLTQQLLHEGVGTSLFHKKCLFALRLVIFAFMAFLICKPQLVDPRSNIFVDGIDIVLALDVSGSMQFQDYADDQRSRLDVAKDEAFRFVNKRPSDSIGLVIFGKDALSRMPLTLDKKMLEAAISSLTIGTIDPDGTVLATALLTAINRLKNSTARSKVIILLTDGAPSEHDTDSAIPIELAQTLGITIYTIGIGSDEEQVFLHPLYGMIPKPKINKPLLTAIAQKTGGSFFLARNAQEMRTIYDTIDSLERTTHETTIFSRYYDIFIPFVVTCIALLALELLLRGTLWFGI